MQCGTRVLSSCSTLSQCGIVSDVSTASVLYRLRGGASGSMYIPGQWQCHVCKAQSVGPFGNGATGVTLPRYFSVVGPLGRTPQQTRSAVPRSKSQGLGQFLRGSLVICVGSRRVQVQGLERLLQTRGKRKILVEVIWCMPTFRASRRLMILQSVRAWWRQNRNRRLVNKSWLIE